MVEKDRRSFWVPSRDLVRDVDLTENTAITVTSTQLREADTWKSGFIATIPSGTKLQIISLKETWAQVVFESVGKIHGWVDLNNVILRSDFASFIQAVDKPQIWRAVRFRDGTHLITEEGTRIELSKITAMKTKPDLGISISSNESQHLLLRQHLKIIKNDNDMWNVSQLKGHGAIYWKNPKPLSLNAQSEANKGLSTDELLKREVVSVSFHPKNPLLGLASAQGIFMTVDGKKWQNISQFGSKNFPVLIDHAGHFYVGPERSQDQGKSFNSYFRWDHLAHLVETAQKHPGKQLRLKELTSPRPGILQIQLETDLGKIQLAARTDSALISKWDFN